MPEFVMVTVLLLLIATAVFQLGLSLYVRNTLISAAAEGARYGARAGASTDDAVDRASELITSSLSPRFADDVRAESSIEGGVRIVRVRVHADLPVFGLLGPGVLEVEGRSFDENQVGVP